MWSDIWICLFFVVVLGLFCTRSLWTARVFSASPDENGELKCIVTDTSGQEKYCVRVRENMSQAAELLERVSDKCERVVAGLAERFPADERWARLREKFDKRKMNEILPTNTLTALTKNKGELVSFCLNKKKHDDSTLIDFDTLFFVALHELSHIATVDIGHEKIFWKNFHDLLHAAEQIGMYTPVDYSIEPTTFCSMKLTDNPYFNS